MRLANKAMLMLVAIGALNAATVTGVSANTFSASTVAALKGKALQTQVFKTKAGSVECSTLAITSGTSSLSSLTLSDTVQYSGCKAFGLTATVSPADYELNADGSVDLVAEVAIKAIGCVVMIPPQTLGGLAYKDSGSEVVIEPKVTGITSEGLGAACAYLKESKGTYTGNSSLSIAGGSIGWS